MIIRTIKEAEAALLPYVPLAAELTAKDITLDRMWPLMEVLGNPQDRLKVVHIAGTSGKTSTAYYIAALLKATGKKIGLTVSPHLDTITERIQIDGQLISETVFCKELSIFLDIIQKARQHPTYYELLYAFALWVFERHRVDYAVVETGLGGLHDATNVATRADKVCIITDIGLDHTAILGETLPEIAAQKIGIVHPKNHCFTYQQAPGIMKIFEQWCTKQQARLHKVAEQPKNQSLLPEYQQHNWHLAYTAYQYLQERDTLASLTSQALQETQKIRVPGRMDIRQVRGKTIVMDGAHNKQKMEVFIKSFQQLYPGIKPAVLLSIKQSKDYGSIVPLLVTLTKDIIVTSFDATQDLPARSTDIHELAQAFKDNGVRVQAIPDQHEAFEALLASPQSIAIITGSFYLLGQIRNNEHIV